ncbi:MAG TPA: carboxylesterase family protein [Allosphingosinicella sp.]|nr:carboxylesterase family protein [Allosphingosinicella sp.]
MSDQIVETRQGQVRGMAKDGVVRFFGIPYAAAPVGARRFQAPAAREAWAGIRDATALGPNAPHSVKPFPGLDVEPLIGSGWRKGDDYLNVNIWAPAAGGGEALRPVMVWIHGGGFVLGSNSAAIQDGSAFARSGIICIAVNYRMGVEGFLPIPGVPTNLGLRDIVFALDWVRDNAAAFGGDPGNVTVFGESAGAMAIADLMTSPLAKGLFRRAIVQSGHGAMVRPIPVAQRLVRKVARILKVAPDEAGFRSAGPEACVKAVEKVSLPTARIDLRDSEGREPVFGISRFVPVYGDDVLPEKPLDALARGAGAEVELLIGTNAEEMNLYLVPTGVRDRIGGLLSWYVLSRSQPKARQALKAYGLGAKGKKPGEALTDAMNDLVFRWPARRFAEEHRGRTHLYEFDWRSPAFGGELGASHGMELPFVFDTLACVTGEQGIAGTAPPQALADRIHRLWAGFAMDGRLPWPEYDRETRQVYRLEKGEAAHEPAMPAARFLP